MKLKALISAALVTIGASVALASTTVSVNGTNYTIPQKNERGWGDNVTSWIQAISANTLQPNGGTFTLSNDVDFGASFGLKSSYFKTRSSNPASAGLFRLANTDLIDWRNTANNGNLSLGVDTSDRLTFNGNPIVGSSALTASKALVTNGSGVITTATTTSTEIGYVNGVTSAIQTQIDGKQATDTDLTAVAGLSSNGMIARTGSGTASVRTITGTSNQISVSNGDGVSGNPTLSIPSDPVLPGTGSVTLPTGTTAQRNGSPANGMIRYNSDISKFEGYQGGGWGALGGGSGINYLASNPDAEAATTGWTTYADAAGSAPVDGTGGSPTITWTRTTSTPLRGTGSFLFTKDAANRQGEGVCFAYTPDVADQGKPLAVAFDYTVASGTFADGDLTIYAVQDTAGTPKVTQLAPYRILSATAALPQKWIGYYQTDNAAYADRICVHTASTSASAYTVKFDNWFVGPTYQPYGAVVTDWVSFTPTSSWVSNAAHTGRWRRVGGTMEVQESIDLGGAPTSANLQLNVPSGVCTIDTAKIPSAAPGTALPWLGGAIIVDGDDGNGTVSGYVTYATTTSVYVLYGNDGTAGVVNALVTQAAPFTFDAPDYVEVEYRVPCVGWSSNVQVSTDADTRVVAFSAYRSGTQTGINPNNSAVKMQLNSIAASSGRGYDTHGGYDAVTNFRYTIPVPGKYSCNASVNIASTNVLANNYQAVLYVNGVAASYGEFVTLSGTAQSFQRSVHGSFNLIAGDYIEFYLYGQGNNSGSTLTANGGSNSNYFECERVSGPAQIAPSEKVKLKYQNTAGTSITSSLADVPFATKLYDSHSSFNGTTFTAPRADVYHVCARLTSQTINNSTSQAFQFAAVVTSTPEGASGRSDYFDYRWGDGVNHTRIIHGCNSYSMYQGDTIKIQANNANTVSLDTTAGTNYITIESQGGL